MSKLGETTPPKSSNLLPAWQPGQSGNPAGRPKGSRHKFSERFVKDFLNDWEKHGLGVIEKVRSEKPDVYLRVATAILPKVSDDSDDGFDDLSPEEIDARLADLEARTAALVGDAGQARSAAGMRGKPN